MIKAWFIVVLIATGGFLRAYLRALGRLYPPLPVCDCSIHDITTPGAAHADDCPAATHFD